MNDDDTQPLLELVRQSAPHDAADALEEVPDKEAAEVLQDLNPIIAQQVLHEMTEEHRAGILAAAPKQVAEQWSLNREYPEDSVGWLMEHPVGIFRPSMTVRQTIEALRKLTKQSFITYGYVTDYSNKLLGVLVMRDLMLSDPETRLEEVMFTELFMLEPDMALMDAMKLAVNRHYPVYPVCDEGGHLLGLVRGQSMFEAHAIEISAQAGSMVGVEKLERLTTSVMRSLRFRQPWLQINLVTCFLAASVVAIFEDTLNRVVLLAAFIPVLAGQSGNTGCQALAVTLRGVTLGDLKAGDERALVMKEGTLGLMNGILVGASAALGMLAYATIAGNEKAIPLALVVWMAMIVSCVVSGLCGALVPLALRKFGADPATASSIFLTTATDVVSMGVFLGLATLFT